MLENARLRDVAKKQGGEGVIAKLRKKVDALRNDRSAPKRELEEGSSGLGKRSRIRDAVKDLEQPQPDKCR